MHKISKKLSFKESKSNLSEKSIIILHLFFLNKNGNIKIKLMKMRKTLFRGGLTAGLFEFKLYWNFQFYLIDYVKLHSLMLNCNVLYFLQILAIFLKKR